MKLGWNDPKRTLVNVLLAVDELPCTSLEMIGSLSRLGPTVLPMFDTMKV